MVSLDSKLTAGVKESGGSHNIRSDEAFRIGDGAVNMALRREIDDHVRFLFFK